MQRLDKLLIIREALKEQETRLIDRLIHQRAEIKMHEELKDDYHKEISQHNMELTSKKLQNIAQIIRETEQEIIR